MEFFTKCNMSIKSELPFIKGGVTIKLPFHFHIKEVKNDLLEDDIENELESYSKDVYFQNQEMETEEDFKYYLHFVDIKNLTFDGIDSETQQLFKKVKDVYVLKDVDSLYQFLIGYLQFNEYDFHQIKLFVKEKQITLLCAFRDMVDKELEVASNKIEPNNTFMILRCAYELNHYATVFSENKGRAISEYSYRELCIQRSYMARKCEIEKLQLEESLKGKNEKKK